MSAATHFTAFVAIDWSGAKGMRHAGIAVGRCRAGDGGPELIAPPASLGRHWSRQAVRDWLITQAAHEPTLFGFDFSFAPPLLARGAYLPGEAGVPGNAHDFWAYVDASCDDPDLGAASFLEQRHRRHFYLGAADGRKSDYMHWRVCEAQYNAGGGGKASTVYDAIGAAQVAKASFAGMRLLHHLRGAVPIWPFDGRARPLDGSLPDGSLVVEIYTSIAARAIGKPKGRSKLKPEELDDALARLNSAPHHPLIDRPYSDHATDALLTAAWLRTRHGETTLWSPARLDDRLAATEGWTFGII